MTTQMAQKIYKIPWLETKCPGDQDCACDERGEGYLKAVFCTFGDIDKDGDIVHAGAVGDQNVLLSAYQHTSWDGALPIGKGRVYEENGLGVFEGHINMELQSAKDTYSAMKFAPEHQEWSWGFNVTKYDYSDDGGSIWSPRTMNIYETEIFEVSPVLIGAGNGTRLVELKSARQLYPDASTKTEAILPSSALVVARMKLANKRTR